MSARVLVAGLDAAGVGAVSAIAHQMATAVGGTIDVVLLTSSATPESLDAFVTEGCLAGRVDRVLAYQVPAHLNDCGAVLAEALVEASAEGGVEAILLADRPSAREAAARAALRLGGACASACVRPEFVSGGGVRVRRLAYGGVAMATLTLRAAPAVCVLDSGLPPAAPADAGAAPRVETRTVPIPAQAQSVTLVDERPVVRSCDLEHAEVVVSVGRGFTKQADLALIDGLVSLLGAETGCSRPIAEDFKWLDKQHLVGLTGATVTPGLYLALGISGQVQHLAGIKGATVVAAVNSDPRSPIVKNADYAVVGDLYKVVPALTEELERRSTGVGRG